MSGSSFITDETPAGDSNAITVSSTALGVTAAKVTISQAGGFHKRCVRVFVTVESNPIRVLWSGNTPTTSVGHLVQAGETFTVEGEGNVGKLLMIATGSDATVNVSYYYNL